MADSPPTETEEPIVRPSEYSPAYQAIAKEASKVHTRFACVWDNPCYPERYKLTICGGPKAVAKQNALDRAKEWYEEYRGQYLYRQNVRVFEMRGEEIRRIAFFLLMCKYSEKDFEHEHVDRERTYTFGFGPHKPSCEIQMSGLPLGLSKPLGGSLDHERLYACFKVPVSVTGNLVPPDPWKLPTLRFGGRITFIQNIKACGSHPDPRYRVVRYMHFEEWPKWRNGPILHDGHRRRSLCDEALKHWPGSTDKSFLRSLNLHFRVAILEWVWRRSYDRKLALNAPTLTARDLASRH